MINSKLKTPLLALSLSAALVACGQEPQQQDVDADSSIEQGQQLVQKPVVYQVFTRLFGNANTTNEPWGTLKQNGVGKFADFNDAALRGIKELGVTHIWYTGVLHHAMVTDYSDFGLHGDDPDVVKGRAGSPYAIKDYYNVNPDLASKPADRLREFEALIARTHEHGMKVIIDIVPNHVARDYHSVSKPQGVEDFGANDDTSFAYKRDNNFYYVVGEDFIVPQDANYQVLGGQSHPLADGKFTESPAKWTGNGARKAQPDINDWYETVKINYGVKPDGSYDFPRLPDNYAELDYRAHYAFWREQELPDSWYKFRDITQYWLEKGVDGFRYDMAEMVPVEFWSFLNSSIKMSNPDAFLLAEVYNPELYRPYIHLGKMDYLYDKVGFYDSLKAIIQGKAEASELLATHQEVADIEQHMLHFLENHDEQRLASPDFAGDMNWGKPAMTVSTLIGRSPSMLYFGQTVGEDGSEEPGFGDPTRTSIFDYIGVPAHQAWMNGGKFDGGALNDEQRALRQFYVDLMALNSLPAIVAGELIPVPNSAPDSVISFERRLGEQRIVVVANLGKHAVFVDIEPEQAMVGKTLLGTRPLYLEKQIPIKLPYQGVTVLQLGVQVDE
ncbi:alpha-amylase family glycosyl hydrolase [Pseudoalteromonas sp. BDTF-M6]|uniref:alpha-amylase family glycosyl hydrolase n=1 Tax=Pseudoalteromonas sp. BDTF-M6 TaxID=2796132 RepID=UPI001BAE7811|nr:alpha-amylase family glycosyl hydrolase [Pseudoalteromonas sp. BDTF-M6]MBS3796497.1 alpha-amylase [Pseudoalteromonas sp. BDTF-M6]